MANKTFEIEVIALNRIVYTNSDIISVILPAAGGFMGILADHTPVIAEVKLGTVTITDKRNEVLRIVITGGFVEVMRNKVILLAEAAEREDEIDIERAEEAKKHALKLLEQNDGKDFDKAQAALQRALLRLNIAKHRKQN